MMGKKIEQAGNWAKQKTQQVGNYLGKTIENIAKNPLPYIETVALTLAGVPPTIANAAVVAANGGSMKDVVIAAGAAYVGQEAGRSVGASATAAGMSATYANIAASATGASASAMTTSLAKGKSFDEALQDGLTAGALSGGTTGIIEAGKYALTPPETGQGIKVVPGKGTELFGDQSKVSGLGLTDKVPTGGGQGLIVDPNIILPPSMTKYGTDTGKVRSTETGGLQPAYTSAADTLTPSSFDKTLAPDVGYKEPKTVTETPEPVISKETEKLASPFIRGALSDLFGLGPKVPGAPSAGGVSYAPTVTSGYTTGLTGERGAGEIESKETGKQRQNVWNEASLRLKDALGV
jgi:hypothetical protein